jgi:putative DNA primase/helicase
MVVTGVERSADIIDLDAFRGQPVTEDMAARQFALMYQGELAYCWSRGSWYRFNGSTWAVQETHLAFDYARRLARKLSSVSKDGGQLQKIRFAAAVEQAASKDPVFTKTFRTWDTDPYLLGTPSGTVNLKTGDLRASDPEDYISKSTVVTPDEFIDCPTWFSFLNQATGGDKDLQHYLQQIAGYVLTGDTSEQCLFFLHGEGGRGKGTYVNTIRKILGDYAVQAAMETFESSRQSGHSTSIAMLNGARMVTASETEEGRGWAEARIKQFTGQDAITARFMRQNDFTFTPQFKLVIMGNHQPSLRTVDEAMRRRFNMIPFVVEPRKKDTRLPEKLALEFPGILRWAIEGCLDWQRNGFTKPQSVIDATADYFEEQNTFGGWLDQYCETDPARRTGAASASELFASWSKFAKSNGEEAGSQKTFSQSLMRHGFRKKATNSGKFYLGLKLRDFREQAPEDDQVFR